MKTLTRKKFTIVILAVVMAFSLLMFSAIGEVHADETQEIITPVEIVDANFMLVEGAAVRVLDVEDKYNNGLRFASTLSATEYKGIMANEKYSDIEFGVFIMPYDYIVEYGDLTEENLFGSQEKQAVYDWAIWSNGGWVYNGTKTRIINIYSTEMTEMLDGNYYLNASITGLLEENIARDFVSAGYIKYTENGVVKYEMADYVDDTQRSNVRSMAYVAQKAIAYTGEDACDDDQKKYLVDNYIAKSVVDNTAKDFAYVDRSSNVENYTFNLPENVTALRVTMNDVEYSEVAFTCEDGVVSIAKSVVDAGIAAGYLANGENVVYIHTVDESGEYPVYKVQEECLVVADKVIMQSDVVNLDKTTAQSKFDAYSSKYIVIGEDIDLGKMTYRLFSDAGKYLTGTFDGRGHKLTVDATSHANHSSLIAQNYGTVKNVVVEMKGGHKSGTGSSPTAFIATNYGSVNNVFVKYTFTAIYSNSGKFAVAAVVGEMRTSGNVTPTITNCMAEIVYPDVASTYCGNTILGYKYSAAADTVSHCYGITNGLTINYYNTKAAGVIYGAETAGGCDVDTCGNFATYGDLISNVSSLFANDGWSKFWTYDTDNNVIKMGDYVIYSAVAE